MAENGFFFTTPYFPREEICRQADDFRKCYWAQEELPVDILKIMEIKLLIEIEPIRDLLKRFDIDALLLSNFTRMIVDYDEYMDDRKQNRLRFSIAHEIGHLVLHRILFDSIRHETPEDWIAFMESIPEKEYGILEYQANEFAGRLLVPADQLKINLDEAIARLCEKSDPSLLQHDQTPGYLASFISRHFGVSGEVIEIRMNREGLWPPRIDT